MSLTRSQLEAVLVELPSKLKDAEEALWRTEQEKIKLTKQLEIRKAQLALALTLERNENGKQKYGNAEAREHALELRLADDERYNELATEWEKACVRLEQAQVDLHYQRYRLKVAELLVQLLTAEGDRDEDRKVQTDRRELWDSNRSADRQARRAQSRR